MVSLKIEGATYMDENKFDLQRITKKLNKYLDEDRMWHTLGVMNVAAAMAMLDLFFYMIGIFNQRIKSFNQTVVTKFINWQRIFR